MKHEEDKREFKEENISSSKAERVSIRRTPIVTDLDEGDRDISPALAPPFRPHNLIRFLNGCCSSKAK